MSDTDYRENGLDNSDEGFAAYSSFDQLGESMRAEGT